jgi:hydroxyacylglutathione hydrolase
MLKIEQIPALRDNYVYLVHDPADGATAAVDPAEAGPVLAALKRLGWRLTHILNTHRHSDHVGGNRELRQVTGCRIFGPQCEDGGIPDADVTVAEGEVITLGHARAKVLEVPGHTQEHIAFWFQDHDALFCGDTLFALGCGRLLGGTASQLWASLDRIRQLPKATKIYCAHEYTEANGRFALTLEPGNSILRRRMSAVTEARRRLLPTVPSTLDEELATNPFLRPESREIQLSVGLLGANSREVFTEVRRRKDRF